MPLGWEHWSIGYMACYLLSILFMYPCRIIKKHIRLRAYVDPRRTWFKCATFLLENKSLKCVCFFNSSLQAFMLHLEQLQVSLQGNKVNKPVPSPMPLGSASPHNRGRNRNKARSKSPNFPASGPSGLNNPAILNRDQDPLSVSLIQRGQAVPLRQRSQQQPQSTTVATTANATLSGTYKKSSNVAAAV